MPNPLTHLFTPFSQVKSYVGRSSKGFLVTPRSDLAPDGWGPGDTEDGTPAPRPGVAGAHGNKRLLTHREADGWKCHDTPGTQLFGNISWRGKLKSPTNPSRGYSVLTYHGPSTRYFATDSFSYDGDDSHYNIYAEGLCVAVAPYPVLGAAIRTYQMPDGGTRLEIVAILKSGADDVVVAKPYAPGSGVSEDGYTAEFREEQRTWYDSVLAPGGWRILSTITCKESYQGEAVVLEARTPWFFDSTGTVAQCMREADITFDRGDKVVTQRGYVRYKVTVAPESASLSVEDNTTGITFKMTTTFTRHGDYSAYTQFPLGGAMGTHYWKTYEARVAIESTGQYVVGVDYDDTEEVLLTLDPGIYLNFAQWFYIGNDNEYGVTDSPNTGHQGGDYYKLMQPDYLPSEGDGVTLQWLGNSCFSKLIWGDKYTYLQRRVSGTKTYYETGRSDPADPWLYYTWYSTTYPHYFNAPRQHLSAEVDETMLQNLGGVSVFQSLTQQYYRGGTVEKFADTPIPQPSRPSNGYAGVVCGWMYSEMATWSTGPDEIRSFRSLDLKLPDDLEITTGKPSPYNFFYNWYTSLFEEWKPLQEILHSSSKCAVPGGHAEDSFGNTLISLQYVDAQGETRYYNALNGETGTLDSLTAASGGNTRYFPLGES